MTNDDIKIIDDDEFPLIKKMKLGRACYDAFARDAQTFGLVANSRTWNKLSPLEQYIWWQAARATMVKYAQLELIDAAERVDNEVRSVVAQAASGAAEAGG